MDKRILDLVADKQREIDREALIAAGHPEAAELI